MPEPNERLKINMQWIVALGIVVAVTASGVAATNHVMGRLATHDTLLAVQGAQVITIGNGQARVLELAVMVASQQEALKRIDENIGAVRADIRTIMMEKKP